MVGRQASLARRFGAEDDPMSFASLCDRIGRGPAYRLVWRCSRERILALYNRHASANHLEAGIGSDRFLDRCRWPCAPRLGLVDVSEQRLEAAARRLARFRPQRIRADVARPLPVAIAPFASIGMTHLLQCLPGTLPGKATVFDHLATFLLPDGVVFGATLLTHGVPSTALSRSVATLCNREGVLANGGDGLDGLRAALAARFESFEIDVAGSAALFSARGLTRRTASGLDGRPDRARGAAR